MLDATAHFTQNAGIAFWQPLSTGSSVMAKRPRITRPVTPITDESENSAAAQISINVTGDVFFERFLWPAIDPSSPLPYTYPDELRTATPTFTFRELSGAQLHAQIIESFLNQCFIKKDHVKQFDKPFKVRPVPDHAPFAYGLKEDEFGPYPVYLHRLGPFPVSERSGDRDEEFVWRIKESFGSVRIATETGAAQLHEKLIGQTEKWLKSIPRQLHHPTIIVVNDRNVCQYGEDKSHTRKTFQGALSSLPKNWMSAENPRRDNLLILWHARQPLFEQNPVGDFLLKSGLSNVTIPIINHNCLRDHGVPLRFDMSYESTIKTLIDALSHDTIDALLHFPHVLVRFDYGILHLTTRADGEIHGLDIHGLNAGPYRVNPQQHGIMTGMTPLLLATIIREVVEFLTNRENPTPTIRGFLKQCARYVHPTLSNSTPLDRALDASLLLAGRHYYSGYGSFKPLQPLPITKESTTLPIYDALFKEFDHAVQYDNLPAMAAVRRHHHSAADDAINGQYTLKYKHVFPAADRLCRLSVPQIILGRGPNSQAARAVFSRSELLNDNGLLRLSPAFKATETDITGSIIDTVLRRIVECGIDRVVTRRADDSDGKAIEDFEKSTEPSILCPFVAFGRHMSTDWRDIDSFLALRHLVEKYIAQGDFDQPLAVAVFGPPGSGKSSLVREILSSISRCKFFDDLVCNLSQLKSPEGLARHFHRVQDRSVKGEIPIVFFDDFDSACANEEVGWLRYFLMPLQDGLYVEGNDTFDVGRAIFIFAGGVSHSFGAFCERFGEMRPQKVPDFISRLRCFVNVQDISFEPGNPELAVQVRRAVILRRILQRRMPQIVDPNSKIAHIWPSITNAFLNVAGFTHGVRSMEAIVQMSRVSVSAQNFQPSALPHPSQLGMHVDASEFMRIVHDA
ncbi:MAG: ATP-binding protein [Planctomycetes bacterium]|nr:ATP-binding protein [Planctomycetota bacterium]